MGVIKIQEIWKSVCGYEGYYEVSNFGRIRSVDRIILRKNGAKLPLKSRILPQQKYYGNSTIPRLRVNLCKNGVNKVFSVHRLVAKAFISNPNCLAQVNHKDENPLNNHVDNLEWCDNIYNHNYGTRNQRQAKSLCKCVDCYDLNMNYIATFDSIKEAAEHYSLDASTIVKVCKGKNKYTKQYVFRYHN